MDILIVGYGVVGANVKQKLEKAHNVDVVDKYKTNLTTYDLNKTYDFAYICVDTPSNETNVCDINEVIHAVVDNKANYYVIKSTILPGTTDYIAKYTKKNVVFSPEFYGGTQHCNNFDFDFTILGGAKKDCIEVQQMLQEVFDARHKFRITDATTAELVKYMENAYLATKVTFCNEFFRIAQHYKVDYEDLRELVTLDPRIDPSHTFVYRSHPWYDSHCLNKDVAAIAEDSNSSFLKNIVEQNKSYKAGNNLKIEVSNH